MNTIPTTQDLVALGTAIAEEGFTGNEEAVADLAALTGHVAPDLAAVRVLADAGAPDVARARAFSVVAAHWPDHRSRLVERQEQFNRSFDDLLSAWVAHDDLQRSNPSTDRLWSSRAALDEQRLVTAHLRGQLAVNAAA